MTRHLTVEDLAERWRTTPKAIHGQRHRGELPPAVRIGRRLLWTTSAIEAFEAVRMEGAQPAANRPRARLPRPASAPSYAGWFKDSA